MVGSHGSVGSAAEPPWRRGALWPRRHRTQLGRLVAAVLPPLGQQFVELGSEDWDIWDDWDDWDDWDGMRLG